MRQCIPVEPSRLKIKEPSSYQNHRNYQVPFDYRVFHSYHFHSALFSYSQLIFFSAIPCMISRTSLWEHQHSEWWCKNPKAIQFEHTHYAINGSNCNQSVFTIMINKTELTKIKKERKKETTNLFNFNAISIAAGYTSKHWIQNGLDKWPYQQILWPEWTRCRGWRTNSWPLLCELPQCD